VYAILDGTTPRVLAGPMLFGGVVVGVLGIVLSGRDVRRTTYRPDHWRLAELLTVASGLFTGAVFVSGSVDVSVLFPSTDPLEWPQLSVVALAATVVALIPAFATPVPPGLDELVPETEPRPVLVEAGR
jgi:energy-coupling factor transport system permease protein